MPSARQSPIRCENLDLFAAPTLDGVSTSPQVVASEESPADALPWSDIEPDDQLDLFRHSPAEIAAVETRRAIQQRAVERARTGLALLRPLPAYAEFVADCDLCLELIERTDPRWADAPRAVSWIEADLWPAADRCLRREAMALLRPALLGLLEDLEQRPRDPCSRHAHPAYVWQLLGEPAHAVAALESDLLWRDHAQTLLWHAELSEDAGLNARVHADIAELCLAWPESAELWLSASPGWASRWSEWCELDDELPLSAFPAWARLTRACEFPLPAADDDRPGAELLRIADRLSRHANDVSLRKALSVLSPTLLATFLATRRGSTR